MDGRNMRVKLSGFPIWHISLHVMLRVLKSDKNNRGELE